MAAFPRSRYPRSKRRPTGDLLLVVGVIVVLVVAAGLLHVVASQAGDINDHAENIAQNTRGIDQDTDTIRLLDRTNALATSIEDSTQPLDEKLAGTVDLAQRIDGKVTSINGSAQSILDSAGGINTAASNIESHATNILGTARAINGTAGKINGTAGNINGEAAAILDVAGRINVDVKRINLNLNDTIAIVRGVRSDTRNLVDEGRFAHKEAACIDREVNLLAGAYNGGQYCAQDVPGAEHDDG